MPAGHKGRKAYTKRFFALLRMTTEGFRQTRHVLAGPTGNLNYLRQLRTAPFLHDISGFRKIADLTIQATHKRRIDLLEYREGLIPDTVPLVVARGICAVIPIRNLVGKHISLDLLPAEREQRPQKVNSLSAK